MNWRTTARFDAKQLSNLSTISVICLGAFILLGLILANGNGPYGIEDPFFRWAGAPSRTDTWANLSELVATPAIGVVLVICGTVGVARRSFVRVAVYAAIAALAFLIGEHIAKPLVHRSYYEELTFPSGSVTAVSALTLAMWLAISPVIGMRARWIGLVIGCAWTLLTAFAVVGALWHTPLDALGSVLLSIGVVTGGVAVYEHTTNARVRPRAGNA
jgi:membrane-associated phospholipid phosphatase